MSQNVCVVIVLLAVACTEVLSAWDCKNPPKDVVKETEECCKSPQLVAETIETECKNKFASEFQEFQRQCFVSTCIMDRLNITSNGNFVSQSAMNLIKATVTNDPIWEQSMEEIAKSCIDYSVRNLEKGKQLFQSAKISIEFADITKCNPLYLIFIACMDADLLTKCPDHSFMQNEKCQNWRTYSIDCGDDNLYLTV